MEKPEVINVLECEGCHVPKGWGEEIIISSTPTYRDWETDRKSVV